MTEVMDRITSTWIGKACKEDGKKGMLSLELIIITAVIALILFLALPPLSDALMENNKGTIDQVTNLQDVIGGN